MLLHDNDILQDTRKQCYRPVVYTSITESFYERQDCIRNVRYKGVERFVTSPRNPVHVPSPPFMSHFLLNVGSPFLFSHSTTTRLEILRWCGASSNHGVSAVVGSILVFLKKDIILETPGPCRDCKGIMGILSRNDLEKYTKP